MSPAQMAHAVEERELPKSGNSVDSYCQAKLEGILETLRRLPGEEAVNIGVTTGSHARDLFSKSSLEVLRGRGGEVHSDYISGSAHHVATFLEANRHEIVRQRALCTLED
jgi:hypothetical protein